jgi:hypothetical protein
MKMINWTPWLLALGACIPVSKDDTAAVAGEDTEVEEEEEDTATEPPASTLVPDYLLFYVETVVKNGIELDQVVYDNSASNGSLIVIMASDAWSGLDDSFNACYIFFDIDPTAATFSTDFVDAGAYAGWTLDAATTYAGTSDSCNDLDPMYAPQVEEWAATNVGFGFGPLEGDLQTDLQSAVEEGGGDWATDWEPYALSTYIYFEGMSGAQAVNYTFSFELGEDGAPVVDEEGLLSKQDFDGAQPLENGLYRGYPFYGFGFGE